MDPGCALSIRGHSWHSLGGDQGNPPAWGCSNANEVYDKVKNSGRYFTSDPPRGALVLYRYGNNGHAAIEHDPGARIATTNPDPDDPDGRGTGVEDNDYPAKWGATKGSAIWTDQYNGVRFPVGDAEDTSDEGQDMFIFDTHSGPAYVCFADGHAFQLSSGYTKTSNVPVVTSPDEATDDRFYATTIRNQR